MSKKERNQIIMLGALLAIIAGTVLYMNRDKLFKAGAKAPPYTGAAHQALPDENAYADLFARPDFKLLQPYGDVPVRPGKVGSTDMFDPYEE